MSKKCPLLQTDCIEHACAWYKHIIGVDPQTGSAVDQFDCAVAWMPKLTIENSQQQRQTAASIDALREEVGVTAVVSRALEMLPTRPRPALPNDTQETNG